MNVLIPLHLINKLKINQQPRGKRKFHLGNHNFESEI